MNEEIELTQGTNGEQEETLTPESNETEEIEITDASELYEDENEQEEDDVDEVAEPKVVNKDTAPKLLSERKKLKSENQSLKERLVELEFKTEVADLKEKFGAIDTVELKTFRDQPQYKSLPLEDVYLLYEAKRPKEERQAKLGVVGGKGVSLTKTMTYDRLSTLDQKDYEKARELIEQGKLTLKY